MLEGLYHFVKNCFFLITILLIILLIYLYFNQNSMIYMPEGKLEITKIFK